MKTTSLRIIGAFLVLTVLWGIVPSVRADETTDYINQIYQDQKDRDDYINGVIERATALRDARWADTEPAAPAAVPQPKLPAAAPVPAPPVSFHPPPVPPDQTAFAQMVRQNQERAQQQILQGQQQVLQRQQQILQQAGRVVPQQPPMPLDPVAFRQMVLQNQERVRQQILQTQQQIMQRSQEIIQQHQLQIMRVQQ